MIDPYPDTAPNRTRRAVIITIAVTATVTAVIVAGAVFALAGNGSTSDATAQQNASACRAFDNGLDLLSNVLSEDPPAPLGVLTVVPRTKPRVTTAAQLAAGKTRTAMEQAAAHIQVLGDREQDWQMKGFDNTAEVGAVKDSIVSVAALCDQAGVKLANIPTG